MVASHLKNTYSSGIYIDCIRDKCKEGRCKLIDIDGRIYLILDGDEIEKCKKKSQTSPSCDCVILKKHYHDKILFVELKGGECSLKQAQNKFKSTTNEILGVLGEKTLNFPSLHHVLVGKLDDSGLKSKDRGFLINGKYCFIDVKPCGSSINEIENFIS